MERRRKALEMLSRLTDAGSGADTWVPVWSSLVLERTVAEVLSANQASMSDLLLALWEIAGREEAVLTPTLANFIRDIVVHAFTRYRTLYDKEDFLWLADGVRHSPTPSQAYLALLALPEELVEQSKAPILDALKGTQFFDEAQRMLD